MGGPDHAEEQLGADVRVDAAEVAPLDPREDRLLDEEQDRLPSFHQDDLALGVVRVALEQRIDMAPLPEEAQDLLGDALETTGGGRFLREDLREGIGQAVDAEEDGREVELVLGLEITVDGSLADTGVRSDVVDQDFVERAAREHSRGCLENGLLLARRLDSRHTLVPRTLSGTDRSVPYHIRFGPPEVAQRRVAPD